MTNPERAENQESDQISKATKHNLSHIANLSKSLSEATSKDKDSKAPGEKSQGPPYKYIMDDYKDWHRSELTIDKEAVEHQRQIALDNYCKYARKGSKSSDEAISNMTAAEERFENRPAKRLEKVLKIGIARDNWINPRRPNGKRPFEVISLESAEDADDYRNRIDAPFQLIFPETQTNPGETIFIGFDATLQTDEDKIVDKLTRSSNVAKTHGFENRLPFGFSTLRYTYNPITGERLSSEQTLRYTIGLGYKTMQGAEKLLTANENPENLEAPLAAEIRFKILSEMHEQNKLYKAMNIVNSLVSKKAISSINRIESAVWHSLENTSLDLIDLDPNLSEVETKPGEFASLKEKKATLLELRSAYKTASADEKPEILKQIKSLHNFIYNQISKAYRGDIAGTAHDVQYATIYHYTNKLIKAEKEGKLNEYKAPQARNRAIFL